MSRIVYFIRISTVTRLGDILRAPFQILEEYRCMHKYRKVAFFLKTCNINSFYLLIIYISFIKIGRYIDKRPRCIFTVYIFIFPQKIQ